MPALTLPSSVDAPDPMGLTHAAFADLAARLGLAPRRAALAAYAAFHRRGDIEPLAAIGCHGRVPEIRRTLDSESPEGTVTKFLLGIPGRSSLRADSSQPINATGDTSNGQPQLPASTPETPGASERSRLGEPTSREGVLETESVVIPMKRRHETTLTLCVSSQVGCAMGCTFCETAQMGLIRSLTTAEIVAQWFAARHVLRRPIKNIVFMGMGEPLDNLNAVLAAVEVFTDHYGPAIPMSGITISTVGRTDGLMTLREAVLRPGWKQLNLAVSINAPNDAIRSSIMPVNRAMPLGELLPILETWPRRKSGAICVEYVLIPGVNDAPAHAAELCERVRNIRCCVNVIPYNPRRGSPWEAPTEESVSAFLAELESRGQFCKRRRTKGRDTMAACGQLGNQDIRRRAFVPLSSPTAR